MLPPLASPSLKPAEKPVSRYLKYELKSFENLPVKIWDDAIAASRHVARSIALAIRQKQQDGQPIVLVDPCGLILHVNVLQPERPRS